MKKALCLFLVLLVCASFVCALDFSSVDTAYVKDGDIHQIYDTLKSMLSQARTDEEKAQVLWRLSRICVDLGDELDDSNKNGKFAVYEEGEQYAIDSIAFKPSAEAYLWKCSNIGRWGQTKGVLNSLKKAGPMEDDLKIVTDSFNCLDSSEAWYVLAVLYDSIPTKSGDAAISYARIACETITDDVIYGGTYQALAEMLYSRNWNAKKRTSEFAKMQNNWSKTGQVNSEKYKYYEGANGSDAKPVWASTALGSMSDREEAIAILEYAQAVYEGRSFHTKSDEENYSAIAALLKKWK